MIILSLWDDVKKFTTKAYLWYSSNKNFVELRFNKDCIKLQLEIEHIVILLICL